MTIARAALEDWLRDYYFAVEHDLGSSGVENFSWPELRRLARIDEGDLDTVVFIDSQSHGAPALRQAIADRWGTGDARRVLVTHGSSEAIYLVTRALVRGGDEVIALKPSYQPLFSIAEAAGAAIRWWRLRADEGFRADVDELRSLMTPRTRLVVANFPNNPTGATISEADLHRLLDVVSSAGAYLLWDAAFAELVHDAPPLPDPSALYDRCVTLGTLSKAYGLAGLRIGWCLGPPEILDECIRLRDYITLYLSPLVERVAERAVRHAAALLDARLPQIGTNLGLVDRWMAAHRGLVTWVRPRGGVSSFVRLAGIPDVTRFCRELAESQRVLLVPGDCFGDPACVRLGFGGSTASVQQGLQRISTALAAASIGRGETSIARAMS